MHRWLLLVLLTSSLWAKKELLHSAADDEGWGDTTRVEVKGVRFGMTREEVARVLGGVRLPGIYSGLPYVIKNYPNDINVRQELRITFGVVGPASNRVIEIESRFYKVQMPERNAIVDVLQEKYGFEDDYYARRPKSERGSLKDDYQNLPQHSQQLDEYITLDFRIDWDNRRERTYLITVVYRHKFFEMNDRWLRTLPVYDTEEKQRMKVRDFL